MQHIVFRVDATIKLASGHLMRCITLADNLKKQIPSITITFITGPLTLRLRTLILEKKYALHELASHADDVNWHQEKDIAHSQLLIQNLQQIDLLIVDHYYLNAKWEKAMAPYCHKLMVVDDLANRDHDCDYLLDQTYGREAEAYLPLVPYRCQLLLGQKHMLLRDEFYLNIEAAKIRRMKSFSLRQVLVSLGGVDPENATSKLVKMLLNSPISNKMVINIICSSDTPKLSEIQSLADQSNNVNINVDCSNMAEQYLIADVAIGASGGSAWERCALGLPTVSVVLADNQNEIAATLDEKGAHINLGHITQLTQTTLVSALTELTKPEKYQEVVRQAFSCCDGLGAKRVTNKLLSSQVSLIHAKKNDMMTMFHWQSDPVVRQYSRQPNPVTLKEHEAWFDRSLSLQTRTLFMIHFNNEAVGVLRLDKFDLPIKKLGHSLAYEVSILIDPQKQGRGIALKALLSIPPKFNKEGIYAYVDKRNNASQLLFSQANFIRINSEQFLRPARS